MKYFTVNVGYRRYGFTNIDDATDFFQTMASTQSLDFDYSETTGDSTQFYYRHQEALSMTVNEIDTVYDCREDAEAARRAYDAEKAAEDLAQKEVA